MKEEFKFIKKQGLEHLLINKEGVIKNEERKILKSHTFKDRYGNEHRAISLYPHIFGRKKGSREVKHYSVNKLVEQTFGYQPQIHPTYTEVGFKPINSSGLSHYIINKEGQIKNCKGQLLKYQTNDSGNRTICLFPKGVETKEYCYNGSKTRCKCYSVDKLVRLTFEDA